MTLREEIKIVMDSAIFQGDDAMGVDQIAHLFERWALVCIDKAEQDFLTHQRNQSQADKDLPPVGLATFITAWIKEAIK